MICLRQDRVWKIWIGIKEELKLEPFRVIDPAPLDIFEKLESSFIALRNLVHREAGKTSLQKYIYGQKTWVFKSKKWTT